VYGLVSKAFVNVRQTGWMLAYMVMPAVASLAAARDERGLDRVKYDGTRMHIAAILPIGLLALSTPAILVSLDSLERMGRHAKARVRPVGRDPADAVIPDRHDSAGALRARANVNRDQQDQSHCRGGAGRLCCQPSDQLLPDLPAGRGRSDLGTVLTTLISNLLIPGIYVFRVLQIDLRAYMTRTLRAPMAAAATLLVTTAALQYLLRSRIRAAICCHGRCRFSFT